MLFGCIHRSPTLSAASEKNNYFPNRLLFDLSKTKYSHICLVSDIKDTNWTSWSTFHSKGIS